MSQTLHLGSKLGSGLGVREPSECELGEPQGLTLWVVLTCWEGAQGAAGSAWGLQENLQEETDCVFEVGQQKRQERQLRERQGGGRGGLLGRACRGGGRKPQGCS